MKGCVAHHHRRILAADDHLRCADALLCQNPFGRGECELGAVVGFAQVAEEDRFEPRPEETAEQRSSRFIGQVTVVAADALLEGPRIRAVAQHLLVVIGLQYQDAAPLQPFGDQAGGYSQVGGYTDLPLFAGQDEADGSQCVVSHTEGLNRQVVDLKVFAVGELAHAVGAPDVAENTGQPCMQKNRQPELPDQRSEPTDVIGVLVGDQQTRQGVGGNADQLEPVSNFAGGQPGVYEQTRPTRFDQQRVSLAATGQQANFHR